MATDQFKSARVTDSGTAVDQLDTAFNGVEQAIARWTGESLDVDFTYPVVDATPGASKVVKALASGKIADGWVPWHYVHLYGAVNAAVAHNTDTLLTFPSEVADTDAFHDAGVNPGRITIPSGLDGTYLVGAIVQFDAVAACGGQRAIGVYKGGTVDLSHNVIGTSVSVDAGTGLKTALVAFGVAALGAADWIGLYVSHQAGLGKTENVYSNAFFALRIGG